MATANDYFPSNYIRAADLGGKPRTVTIDRVAEDLFENDGRKQKKAIAHFRENGVKRNYSPRVRRSRAGCHGRGLCQGVADGGESAAAVATAGFDN